MKAVKLTPKERELFEELKSQRGGYCASISDQQIPFAFAFLIVI